MYDKPTEDTKGSDVFRKNGAYTFGYCYPVPTLLNFSNKESVRDGGWISINDPQSNMSLPIHLSRNYTWELQNAIYGPLTLKVDVPDIQSDSVCIKDYQKSAHCLSYQDKHSIETAFADFDYTQLGQEVNSLVASLQTYNADKAVSIYENHFKDKTVFRDADLGISFSYPSIFGAPKDDSTFKGVFTFSNNETFMIILYANTLAETIKKDPERYRSIRFLTQERWVTERKILEGDLGPIKCPLSGHYCEIAMVGSTKMLIRYSDDEQLYKPIDQPWPIGKEYVFYAGDKRFDVSIRSAEIVTSDLEEYRMCEKKDFTLKLLQEIVESIKIEDRLVNNSATTPITENREVYFGNGWNGEYSSVNVKTGEIKALVPSGYKRVDQHEYNQFSKYLILEKDNDVFSYNLENNILNSIFEPSNDLKLKKGEEVWAHSSITEKNKFFIIITQYDLSKEHERGILPTLNTRSYVFDASTNKLVGVNNLNYSGCMRYDSKNQRFFTWPCGEGIGYSAPLFISDMTGQKQIKIIPPEEFECTEDNGDLVAVRYMNGMFFAYNKFMIDKIVVVDPQPVNPTKEVYVVGDALKSQMTGLGVNSIMISKDNNTIIIGGDNFILLFRFDSNKQIIKSDYITDQGIDANFIFVYNGKLYYKVKGSMQIVDLNTW